MYPGDWVAAGPRVKARPENVTFVDPVVLCIPAHRSSTTVLRSVEKDGHIVSCEYLDM